jgi:hypothetical protein
MGFSDSDSCLFVSIGGFLFRNLNGELETCVKLQGLRRSEGYSGIIGLIGFRRFGLRAKRESVSG